MSKEQNSENKFFYPCCQKTKCNGLLNIQFNDNYSLNYECEKNSSHKRNNIYFKNFERFYLKEKKIEICSKCLLKLDSISYKCNNCEKLYCGLCFVKDEHIQKDINNIKIYSEKCLLDNRDLTHYCSSCSEYYCFYCLNNIETQKYHSSFHDSINLIDNIPSKYNINELKDKINKRSKFYEKVINSINQWESFLITNSIRLKQNLSDEIILLEKLILNYNQYFLKNAYITSYNNINTYLENKNDELLNKLSNCFNIEEQTKILLELFNKNKIDNTKVISKKLKNTKISSIKMGDIIKKINNDFYLKYTGNKFYLLKYDEIFENFYDTSVLDFKKEIYSFSISPSKNQI